MPDAAAAGTAPAALAHVQRWMLSATTHPGGLAAGLRYAGDLHGLDAARLLTLPEGADPQARLAIYANGYWQRLIEALRAEFPALCRLLGDDLFGFFARAYLSAHPPRAPSLHTLGAGFPAFLRASQRRQGQARDRFPVQLAWLERALAEASRAEGLEAAAHAPAVDASALALGWPCRIGVPATTRLAVLSYPCAAFRDWLSGTATSVPEPAQPSFLCIGRHRFRTTIAALSDWQFFALRHAARGRRPLQACAQAAARRTGRDTGEVLALLALWLPDAQASSLVTLTPLNTPAPPALHLPSAFIHRDKDTAHD
ncbi:DNA-binding domain-containing protein [Xanthomonas sp. 3498]|uniref:HvfC/BufC N-terminal domain-containing protein n=1 Tax=Xanthomonas sp. 3498 TaxID=2663863 RepID=UPI0017CDCD6F|nr:DNA-binding domain-containing protein [Xanthomonas sp. 3498]MBB5877893.1 hypothetical protein [Xanthomonas sp. 3498]